MGTGRPLPRLGMDVQPELSRATAGGAPRRIATISVHTSPLDQPGTGDAGGLNVYVVEVARQLARRGIEVEIFTRAVCRDTPPVRGARTRGAGQEHGGRAVRGTRQELAARADLPVHLRRAAHRGRLRARPVRPGARALLAVRPGRDGGRVTLAGAAGAVHAHPGQGQEPGPGQRRLRRARGQDPGRGRGRGGRRPAGRQHRGRGAAADRAVRRHPAAGRDGQPGRGPVGVPACCFCCCFCGRCPAAARAGSGRDRAGLRGPDPAAEGPRRGAARRGVAAAPGAGTGRPAGGGVRGRAERVRGGRARAARRAGW